MFIIAQSVVSPACQSPGLTIIFSVAFTNVSNSEKSLHPWEWLDCFPGYVCTSQTDPEFLHHLQNRPARRPYVSSNTSHCLLRFQQVDHTWLPHQDQEIHSHKLCLHPWLRVQCSWSAPCRHHECSIVALIAFECVVRLPLSSLHDPYKQAFSI